MYNYYYDKLDGNEDVCVDHKLYDKILQDYFGILLNGMVYEKRMYELDKLGPMRIVKVPLPEHVLDSKFDRKLYWDTGRIEKFDMASPGYVYKFMWYTERSWIPNYSKRWIFRPCAKYRETLSANLKLPNHEEFEEYVKNDKSIINKPKRHRRESYLG
jgi:hypothetical protein